MKKNLSYLIRIYAKFVYKCLRKRIKLKSVYGIYLLFNKDSTFNYCLEGTYGSLISDEIHKLNVGDLFIDVGANQGLFSILASKQGAKVLSFEPNFDIFKIFLDNLSINDCDNVYPLNFAIYNILSEKNLFHYKEKTGKSFIIDNRGTEGTVLTVDRNFLSIIENIKFNNCIIKIDVEGAEYIVLRELENIIVSDNRITTIIVEINPSNLKRFSSMKDQIYELLIRNNFTPQRNKDVEHYDEIFFRQ